MNDINQDVKDIYYEREYSDCSLIIGFVFSGLFVSCMFLFSNLMGAS